MRETYQAVVVGAGIVGASTAFHLAKLGMKRVLLLDRGGIASGGTRRSCAIIRTHYSIPSNTELAVESLTMFRSLDKVVGLADATSRFVSSGYLILAPSGEMASVFRKNLETQADHGANTFEIDAAEARRLHPLLDAEGVEAIGYEPDSGYADPYLATAGFINGARRAGVDFRTGVKVTGIRLDDGSIKGLETSAGEISTEVVVFAMGPWSSELEQWLGCSLPLEVTRHTVLTLRSDQFYAPDLPIVKDLDTHNKMYFRPASRGTVLVGTGDEGEPVDDPDRLAGHPEPGLVTTQKAQVGRRMPGFLDCDVADWWFGPYDITPDWNPVIDAAPSIDGAFIAYGFSGHGFKLAPAVGKALAQLVLGEKTGIDISGYRLARFAEQELLTGSYGVGSIS